MLSQIVKGKLTTSSYFTRYFTTTANTTNEIKSTENEEDLPLDTKIYRAADKILEERIKPFIQQDGGDVVLEDVKDGVLIVSLSGACQGCHAKSSTLYGGILGIIQEEVPGVKGIREKLDFDDI
ncbi:NifU-like domain containing protein [Tritrichomonas foetus]|uniref:NifU-like domain containing protein n=1 Tax=Tritrichomonas foetus TaxID=1144522 RepID=A0A1J4JID3_9EUKA|nr:NifU-like domain containing protein [Tritrichomonas foetus]|eukprot:OHS98898.1 NifU-like domain containing protein [Tritrichomonas foetus]